MTRYRTIVVDPPWDHSDGTGWNYGADDPRGRSGRGDRKSTAVPYGVMPVSEIAKLPVAGLADDDAHLYLWTTQRYLQDAIRLVDIWQFSVVKLLVWCKPPSGFAMGGAWGNACEFVVFARRGQIPTIGRVPRDWWVWPRTKHSAKPDAFLDLVEQVSPGPYAELFARRARFGWDYPIGDQSLGGVAA